MSTCVLNFDMINPRAQAWAGQRSATAVRGITAEARRAVRNILARGFAEGIPHGQMARMLRSVIGLTEGQANAVMNLRASILKNPGKLIRAGKVPIRVPKAGFTEAMLERRLKGYARRLLNRRAYVIARNETMTAANIGQHQLWQQAQEQRLLRKDAVKEWIITPDNRLCEICEPLSGLKALLNEPFENIGVQGPPAHILCRCTMGLGTKPWKPTKASGLADPGKIENTLAAYTRADGSITPARKALHDRIVANSLKGIPTHKKPVAYMMGGGTASGKSTMLKSKGMRHVPSKTQGVHVNPDDIKLQLPEYKAMRGAGDRRAAVFAHDESSMLAKRITREASKNGNHIIIDGTGDGTFEKLQERVRALRSAGYRIEASYASNNIDLAQKLAQARGVRTGRFVPRSVIRYIHGNVSRVVREATAGDGLFDSFVLYDTNIKDNARIVARMLQGKQLTIVEQNLWADFLVKEGL